MSDARALLRAKRQEVRINHPLASYNAGGQLRCIACGTIVKEGTSWNGHLGSKAHRTNAARLREEEKRREMEEELARQKRKAEDDEEDEPDPKRPKVSAADDEDDEDDSEDVSPAPAARHTANGLPADFFSDPSQAPPPPSLDDGEDEPEGREPAAPPAAPAPSAIDHEWEQFEAAVINVPDTVETYERATVFAEPVLAAEVPEGFPPQETQVDGTAETRDVLDEAEKRRRKEIDERELIMDRLMDEEQAQEEADARVLVLKARLDAMKKQRALKKAKAGAK